MGETRVAPHNRVLRALFVVYVAANMMLCSILFALWALPRETISGFIGRNVCLTKPNTWQRALARLGEWIVNNIYFWEPNHCVEVYRQELEARRALYGDRHD
jgi:hypothetical protein